MTSLTERETIVSWVQTANESGVRLEEACSEAGITLRTYRRWFRSGVVQADNRPTAVRPEPSNKLSEAERERIIGVCNDWRFASLPPSQIVPTLLDEGRYYGSESTFIGC